MSSICLYWVGYGIIFAGCHQVITLSKEKNLHVVSNNGTTQNHTKGNLIFRKKSFYLDYSKLSLQTCFNNKVKDLVILPLFSQKVKGGI